jgi:hypothetical protein
MKWRGPCQATSFKPLTLKSWTRNRTYLDLTYSLHVKPAYMTRFVKENSQIPKRSDEDRFVQRSSNKFQTLKTLNPSQKSWIRNRTKDHNIFSACVQSLIIWLQQWLAPSHDHATKPQFRLHFQQEAKARKRRVKNTAPPHDDCTHRHRHRVCW